VKSHNSDHDSSFVPTPLEPRGDPFQQAFTLAARVVLRRLLHFRVLPSTNAYAKAQGEAGEPEGLVVLADAQTAGVGRMGRTWYSPPGGLYLSVLLRPTTLTPEETPLLSLMAGIAVAQVLRQAHGLQATLKWPNDVILGGRKVAGILAEQSLIADQVEYAILGIGINANTQLEDLPPDLRPTATTLREALGRPVELPRLFGYLAGQLELWYLRLRDKGYRAIIPHWRRLCPHLGKQIAVTLPEGTITGLAEDVAPDGALVLRTPTSKIHIRAADIIHLRTTPNCSP